MLTCVFWRATFERSLSTAAQAVLLAIGTDIVEALKVDAFHLNWLRLASFAAGGALLAVLKAMAAAKISGSGPGFGTSEVLSTPTPEPVSPDRLRAMDGVPLDEPDDDYVAWRDEREGGDPDA